MKTLWRVEIRHPSPADTMLSVFEFDTEKAAIRYAKEVTGIASQLRDRYDGKLAIYEVDIMGGGELYMEPVKNQAQTVGAKK